jgi:hypothetical protein
VRSPCSSGSPDRSFRGDFSRLASLPETALLHAAGVVSKVVPPLPLHRIVRPGPVLIGDSFGHDAMLPGGHSRHPVVVGRLGLIGIGYSAGKSDPPLGAGRAKFKRNSTRIAAIAVVYRLGFRNRYSLFDGGGLNLFDNGRW